IGLLLLSTQIGRPGRSPLAYCGSRYGDLIRVLGMTDEGLRGFTTAFQTPEPVHLLVERPPALDGALVDETGGALQFLRIGDIDIVGGVEGLRLRPEFHFIIVKSELLAAPQPRVIGEQGGNAVVAMGIDRPMGKKQVRIFGVDETPEFLIAIGVDFGMSIDLVCKYSARTQHFAGLQSLRRPD